MTETIEKVARRLLSRGYTLLVEREDIGGTDVWYKMDDDGDLFLTDIQVESKTTGVILSKKEREALLSILARREG